MRSFLSIVTVALAMALGGCASGPQFDTVQNKIAPLAQGKGRIFIYRSTSLGAAIQPDVKLNGVVVGSSKGNGIFYVDRDPGNMEVVIGTEVEKRLTFVLEAGDVRYVKCDVSLGVLVYRIVPILVDEKDAKGEIADLAFTGGS